MRKISTVKKIIVNQLVKKRQMTAKIRTSIRTKRVCEGVSIIAFSNPSDNAMFL